VTRAQLLAVLEAEKPPGFFDHVRRVLGHYVDTAIRRRELMVLLCKIRPGAHGASALAKELAIVSQQALELAEFLKICPGDPVDAPPRLQ
jgi:hypothetical protein